MTKSIDGSESKHRLAIALAASIVLGILVAWSPRFWSVAALNAAVSAVLVAWLFSPDFVASTRRVSLPPEAFVVLALCSWGGLQLLFGWSIAPAVSALPALEWAVAGIAFFLASQILRSTSALASFLSVLVFAATVFSLLAVLQTYTAPDEIFWLFHAEPRSMGTFLYRNQFAAMLELNAPIALYWIFFREPMRWPGVFVFCALLGGAIVSGSRTGTILIVAEFVVILLLAFGRGKIGGKLLLALLPGMLLVGTGVVLIFGADRILDRFQEAHPYLLRQELLKSTIAMFPEHPLVGFGMGAWKLVYPRFATFDLGAFANAAHNDWAEWTAESGFLFSVAILLLFAVLFRPAIKSIWGLGFIAIFLHSWVDYPTREPVILVLWLSLAGALSTFQKSHGPKARRSNSGPQVGKLQEGKLQESKVRE